MILYKAFKVTPISKNIFLLKIGHDDGLVPAEVAGEVGEAREAH